VEREEAHELTRLHGQGMTFEVYIVKIYVTV
jgi:hypothetical protein